MAYFDCQIVQGGGGVTDIPLIVTCTSAFAGLTISCTDGITTFTAQCPSSSPYTIQFDLPNTGTWTVSGTISGTTYSESVLVQNFTVDLVDFIDITVDFYSAANDTVSYTGIDGQTHTITTDSNGHASATIAIKYAGSTINFTSSVAKATDNLANPYSKAIALTRNTTAVYVMPDKTIYWYGYENSTYGTFGNPISASGDKNIVRNTNSIELTTASNWGQMNTDKLLDMHSLGTNLKVDCKFTGSGIQLAFVNPINYSNWNGYDSARKGYLQNNNQSGVMYNISITENVETIIDMVIASGSSSNSCGLGIASRIGSSIVYRAWFE